MPHLLRALLISQSHPDKRSVGGAPGNPPRSTAGVTLLEVLVSMILVTIIVTIITPPIFLAVGTRVRHRRTEQAMQIAQDEVERVRLLMQDSKAYVNIQDELPPIDAQVGKDTIHLAAAPTALCNDFSPCPGAQQLAQTPQENGQRFFVQTFREPGATAVLPSGDANVVAFRMGVRVYGSDALDGNAVKGDLQTEASRIGFTTGPGYINNPKPLVTMYTEMVRGTESGGLSAIQDW